jgi:virulence factor Mce-like protein
VKRILISTAVLLAAGAFVFVALGSSSGSAAGTYKIELDNAFGLVSGADFKVAGVAAGTIKSIDLCSSDAGAGCQHKLDALVTVQVTQSGFGQFHKDTTCESRPQSLIGEYFVDCNPGTRGSPVLKAGSTITVSHTQSTIPADLLQDVMRMPYRERFTLIINELGAATAARSDDLQAALRRAVPALDETDSLLNLLANDSTTIQNLTRDSNTVITALADNSTNVNRFIDTANRTAVATATQQQNLRGTFQNLPPLLEQLKPSLAQLGTTVTTNEPVLRNLNSGAGEINRLLADLPPFARSAGPAIKSLGQASVTGKAAVTAATPTVADLNQFAKPTPELAQNLAIVLHDLDDQGRAVEPDPRSPGGKGFTGLQALLGYVFNQALAINYYGPLGHMLGVDAFTSTSCATYATPATVAMQLKQFGPQYRQCYSYLGPNQPGVTTKDPSDPSATIPDPGGANPGVSKTGGPSSPLASTAKAKAKSANPGSKPSATKPASTTSTPSSTTPASSGSSGSSSTTSPTSAPGSGANGGPPINLPKSLGQILSGIGGGSGSGSSSAAKAPAAPTAAPSTTGSSSTNGSSGGGTGQAQALLNYLLTP